MVFVTLKSCDNEEFTVEQDVAFQSITVKNMIEDTGGEDTVPLPNVNSRVLSKILEFCTHHVKEGKKVEDASDEATKRKVEQEIDDWDKDFMKVDQAVLYDLILAANYLNIKTLLDLCCKTVADIIRGKTPEEIRQHFHIKNDFTPEEEEEVRRENQWAFE